MTPFRYANVSYCMGTTPSTDTYDRRAALYERVVGNRAYNRLLWGTSPATYRAFAADAVASADGPLLEVACGTAQFTADAYARTSREVVLLDRSAAMLDRARERASGDRVAFVQGELAALPDRRFTTVLSMGLLHLLEDLDGGVRQLAATGDELWVTSLVAETGIGRRYLRQLHRAGEVAAVRSAAEVTAALTAVLGAEPQVRVEGCMLFARGRTPAQP